MEDPYKLYICFTDEQIIHYEIAESIMTGQLSLSAIESIKEIMRSRKIKYDNEYFKNKIKTKVKFIDTACSLGINIHSDNSFLIQQAIQYNDIIALSVFLKYNIDLNAPYVDGDTFIHECIRRNNSKMLEIFLKRGANDSYLDDNHEDPLSLAIREGLTECIKVLVEHKTIINPLYFDMILMYLRDNISQITDMMLHILRIAINKVNDLGPYSLLSLRTIFLNGHDEIIKIVFNRFPKIANIKYGKNMNLPLSLILHDHPHTFRYLLESGKWHPLNRLPDKTTYAHMLANFADYDNLKILLDRYPRLAKTFCADGRTTLEYTILPCENKEKTDEEIIKILQLLIEHGAPLNHRNNLRFTLLECAIQNAGRSVVEFIVNAGIKFPKHIGSKFKVLLAGNDPLGFAIYVGKIETFKYLYQFPHLRHKPIESLKEIYKMPNITSDLAHLLLAIMYTRIDIISYLLDQVEIKTKLNYTTDNFFLNFALNHGVTNIDILKHFAPMEQIQTINLDDIKFVASYYNNLIDRQFPDAVSSEVKKPILTMLYIFTWIMKELLTMKDGEMMPDITYDMVDVLYKYIDILGAEDSLVALFSNCIDYYVISDIRKCLFILNQIKIRTDSVNSEDSDESCTSRDYLDIAIIRDTPLRKYISKIKRLFKALESIMKLESIDPNNLNDGLSYNIANTFGPSYVRTVLFKLLWPIKQPHYTKMYDLLMDINNMSSETDDKFIMRNVKNRITVTIIKMTDTCHSPPNTWFRYYKPNIGKSTKSDINHMFPFGIDFHLQNIPCYQKTEREPEMNTFVRYCYFPGYLDYDGEQIKGCFEYFIDKSETLFHRFFRPYDRIHIGILKKLRF